MHHGEVICLIPSAILLIENDDDRQFMTNLYLDYYALMKKNAMNIVHDEFVCDDLIHNACIKLIRNIVKIRQLDCWVLASYIVSTIKSVCFDYLKSSDIRELTRSVRLDDNDTQDLEDEDYCIETEVLHKLDADHLMRALEKLPPLYRDVLYFKYLQDSTVEEIAAALHIGKDSVYQYLTRARRKALDLLQERNN